MTKEEYFEKSKFIWQTFVPKSGQSEYVQGELLRAIEKLRDEAQRNGNINFNDECHRILIEFLRKNLSDTTIFDQKTISQINVDLDKLNREDEPYLEDDIYDRICDRIVDWYIVNEKPIPHIINTELNC
jgi:hypothetical protein